MNTTELRQKINKANDMLNRLCSGEQFTMRIPARPDMDSDLILGDGLQAGENALSEVERLTAELKQAKAAISALVTYIDRGNWADNHWTDIVFAARAVITPPEAKP